MSGSGGCVYVSVMGQAFGWTQVMPTMIALTLKVVAMIMHQTIFVALGLYLYIGQMPLWAVQSYMQTERPNPLCQAYHTYAFPNIEMYYLASIVTFVVVYSLVWNVEQSWFMWLTFYVMFVVPPGILVFYSYNTWFEVLASLLIGVAMMLIFIGLMYVYIKPSLCYILNIFPCRWLGYTDTWLATAEEQLRCSQIRSDLDAVDLYLKRGSR